MSAAVVSLGIAAAAAIAFGATLLILGAAATWPASFWRALAAVLPEFEFEEGALERADERWPSITSPQ